MRRELAAMVLVLGFGAAAGAEPAVLENRITVQVEGKVRHPGVYALPPGARRADALQAAGGPLKGADLGNLNLANALHDGEALQVPVPTQAVVAPPAVVLHRAKHSKGSKGGAPGQPIDLNSANSEQLQSLPGVGPSMANDILAYRNAHGSFKAVEELREIAGIGERRLARLKPMLRI